MRLRKCAAVFFTLFKFLTGYAHICRNQRDRSATAQILVWKYNAAYLQFISSRGKTLRQLIASESESLITDALLQPKNARLLKAIATSKRFAYVKRALSVSVTIARQAFSL